MSKEEVVLEVKKSISKEQQLQEVPKEIPATTKNKKKKNKKKNNGFDDDDIIVK